jgi:hypothetical protein
VFERNSFCLSRVMKPKDPWDQPRGQKKRL